MREKEQLSEKSNDRAKMMLGGLALAGSVMIGVGVIELATNGIAAAETVLGFSLVLLGASAVAANIVNDRSINK